jgi:CspA family cold shock protein
MGAKHQISRRVINASTIKSSFENAMSNRGTVKFFGQSYGFITPDGGGKDVFVHHMAIVAEKGEFRTLQTGDTVEYESKETEKGVSATRVTRVKAAANAQAT